MQLTTVARTTTLLPKSSDKSSTGEPSGNAGYEDGIEIGGIFCGKEIETNLLAEMLTDRRYVIRQRIEPTYARRIGEVCGGDQYGGGKSFQATKPNGDHVAIRRSLKAAARTLIQA